MKASDCPPHFTDFLNDLVKTVDGSTDADAEKDKELRDFTSGRLKLDVLELLSHAERLLLVVQKWRMAGEQHTVEILEKGGMAAMDAYIQEDIRAGRAPEWAFFDPAAWDPESSDYGRLLDIQDLPDSAKLFFCNTIDTSAFQIDPDLDGQPDYELGLFVESYTYLEPAEIISHAARLLLQHTSSGKEPLESFNRIDISKFNSEIRKP
jgi:hypothetical protein